MWMPLEQARDQGRGKLGGATDHSLAAFKVGLRKSFDLAMPTVKAFEVTGIISSSHPDVGAKAIESAPTRTLSQGAFSFLP